MSARGLFSRIVGSAALAGFTLGAASAIHRATTAPHMREFQAGADSGFGERALSVAQRAAIDGVGFAAFAAVLAILALLLCALWRKRVAERGLAACAVAGLLIAATAMWGWVDFGCWLANELIPFLSPAELLGVNLAGYGVSLAAALVFHEVARWMPGTRRVHPAAAALASMASLSVAFWCAWKLLTHWAGAVRDVYDFAFASACFPAALGSSALLSRLLDAPVSAIAARFARGPMVPRALSRTLLGALVVAIAVTIPTFSLSPVPKDPSYEKLAARGAPAGPNVIYITIDTLRPDRLGCYGYDRPTSPCLDAIAADGTRFLDPVSAAPWTKPATGTLLTGLYPSRHGALHHGSTLQIPEGERTLAEAFQAAGYVTAGFVSNPNIKKIFKFDRGFDVYFDAPVEDTITLSAIRKSFIGSALMSLTRHQFNWKYENDVYAINREALPWIEANRDRRFFVYLHYIDPHEPYTPHPEREPSFARDHGWRFGNDRKRLLASDLYDGEVRYCDDGLSELVKSLKQLGIWDDALVVVTSDHGEEFFEHGWIGHGYSVYQELIRVPLLVRGPSIPRGQVVRPPVAILDLPATMLELAGTGVDKLGDGHSFAKSLQDPEWKRAGEFFVENQFGENEYDTRSFVMDSVREGSLKLVFVTRNAFRPPQRFGFEELFDLCADPAEQKNLIKQVEHEQVVAKLRARLQEHIANLEKIGLRGAAPPPLDEETAAALRNVGYLK